MHWRYVKQQIQRLISSYCIYGQSFWGKREDLSVPLPNRVLRFLPIPLTLQMKVPNPGCPWDNVPPNDPEIIIMIFYCKLASLIVLALIHTQVASKWQRLRKKCQYLTEKQWRPSQSKNRVPKARKSTQLQQKPLVNSNSRRIPSSSVGLRSDNKFNTLILSRSLKEHEAQSRTNDELLTIASEQPTRRIDSADYASSILYNTPF